MATSIYHAHIGNHFDRATRTYLLALKAGKKPSERPDTGPRWEPLISVVERAYSRSHGAIDVVERTLDSLCAMHPDLAELLADPPLPFAAGSSIQDPTQMLPLPEAAQLPEELSRGACPELDMYEAYSRLASPEAWPDYHAFCGLWCFSTVAARRVHLELGPHSFYTNLMIALVARSTIIAKSSTALVAKKLLAEADLDYLLMEDDISPQKLLSNMAGMFVPSHYGDLDPFEQQRIEQNLAMSGQRGWYDDEFGQFVLSMARKGSTTVGFEKLLLKLDACPPRCSQDTFSRSFEPVKKPYLAFLGAMTASNFRMSQKSGSDLWGSGFWPRFSFVCAPFDFMETHTWGMERLITPPELIQALKAWHNRLGVPECSVVPQIKDDESTGKYVIERGQPLPDHSCAIAQDAYEGWKQYREALRSMIVQFKNEDLDGNYGRLPEVAMRMAVIMASLSNNNRIELRHWARAQELAEVLRRNLHELYNQVNAPAPIVDKTAQLEKRILEILQRRAAAGVVALTVNSINKSYLKNPGISNELVEKTLRGLQRAGMVTSKKTSKSTFYSLVDVAEEEENVDTGEQTEGSEEIGEIESWE